MGAWKEQEHDDDVALPVLGGGGVSERTRIVCACGGVWLQGDGASVLGHRVLHTASRCDDVWEFKARADRLEAALREVVSELAVRHHSLYTKKCEICRAYHVARAALEGDEG